MEEDSTLTIRSFSVLIPGRSSATLLLACALLATAAGCGRPPQVAGANRALVVSLATAVSARNNSWLDENAKLLEQRRAAGQCTDAEYKAFKAIIDQALAGDWKPAEDAIYALRDAQEPTAGDLENLSRRKLGADVGLPKTAAKASGKSP